MDFGSVRFYPQPIGADKIFPIMRAVNLEKFCQPPRAFRPFHPANKHGFRTSLGTGHDIQHFMHSVAEINIGASAGGIHHIRPCSPPFVRMTGCIFFAAIRLGFGNAPPYDATVIHPAAKPRADKHLRRRHRVNSIIFSS